MKKVERGGRPWHALFRDNVSGIVGFRHESVFRLAERGNSWAPRAADGAVIPMASHSIRKLELVHVARKHPAYGLSERLKHRKH